MPGRRIRQDSTAPARPTTIFDIALARAGKRVAAGECDQPRAGRDICLDRYEADSPY
ncbi:hypothetical protein [Streptomyces sp. NPDC051109]|uniref:hypothetical protein n=1 Tax=Streptomyces sp. NPDC051109 TaxID=3365642 RepID=UPI0037A0A97E